MGVGKTREPRRRNRFVIEALEGRAVPATFHAANVTQLLADVAAVNNSSGPNTIVLAAHSYDLSNQIQITNANNLTIQGTTGKGAATSIVGSVNGRIFTIDGGSVTISNLGMSGNSVVALGGAIAEQNANLTVENCTISSTLATLAGGGIFAQGGVLNVDRSLITGNQVNGVGGSLGGGIAAVNATVNISGSTITNNNAYGVPTDPQTPAMDAGGGVFTQGGTLHITNTKISRNIVNAFTSGPNASGYGGAVATAGTVVTVDRSQIQDNRISTIATTNNATLGTAFSTNGGSLNITGSVVSGNLPGGTSEFFHPNKTPVVIQRSTVDGHQIAGSFTLSNDEGSSPSG
jgi:hypothetical protein